MECYIEIKQRRLFNQVGILGLIKRLESIPGVVPPIHGDSVFSKSQMPEESLIIKGDINPIKVYNTITSNGYAITNSKIKNQETGEKNDR